MIQSQESHEASIIAWGTRESMKKTVDNVMRRER